MPNNHSEVLEATLDAEEALIGSILLESSNGSRETINKVALILKPQDFYDERHQVIFKAMIQCPLPPQQINTARQIRANNELAKDIISHMSHCIATVPCSLDYQYYAEAVLKYSELRTGKKRPHVKGAQCQS